VSLLRSGGHTTTTSSFGGVDVRRSDVDGRQGDTILISDQVKQKDNSSRLKASRRAKHRPTAADPACAQTATTSLWSMLWTAAPAMADRCSCGLISAAVGSSGDSRISTTAAWIWRRGGRPMRGRRPSTTRQRRGRQRRWEWSCVGGQCQWRSDGEL
jgi:hypothetical protein